jgi:hypothetical protein
MGLHARAVGDSVRDRLFVRHRSAVRDRFVCGEQAAPPYGGESREGRAAPDGLYRFPVPRPAEPRGAPEAASHAVERAALLADGMALSLRAALDRITAPLAVSAAAFVRRQAWCMFGYARIEDHSRERFGRSGRWVRDLATLGEALEMLPGLDPALTGEDGGRPIGRVAATLIGRIADPGSLAEWIARARRLTVRELREEVSRARASIEASTPPSIITPPSTTTSPSIAAPPEETEAADRVPVRIPVPAPVLAAFDEALALFRAVEGREATVTSFVEALVAECFAGPHPPEEVEGSEEASSQGVRLGPPVSLVEGALARSTDRWSHLPVRGTSGGTASSAVLGPASRALERLRSLTGVAGQGGPEDLDRQLRRMIALEDELEAQLGQVLAEMADRGAWTRLRFAGVGHYAEERLGLSRTAGEDRARAARTLRRFGHLRRAYESGRIGLEAVLIVARILGEGAAGPACERAWVGRAAEASVKRLRDEARALGLRRCLGPASREPLSDAEWHASLRRVRGTARARLEILGRATLGTDPSAARDAAALPPPDPMTCRPSDPDVFLRLRLPASLAADLAASIESQRRALEALAESVPWDEPWPEPEASPSLLAARTFSIRCRRLPSWVGLLAMLEDFAATWDAADGAPVRPQDTVFIRDGWRCTAPGCTSRRNLEDHHLVYRSRNGSGSLSNRTTLCRFHHQRGEHGGLASCAGQAPLGVAWRLGRDGIGGRFENERRESLT